MTITNDLSRLANNANVIVSAVSVNSSAITAVNVAGTLTVGSVVANGGLGTNGQALTTNGTHVYWSTIVGTNTDATYVWTNNHTFGANVIIQGNLTVTGTTTTINTTTLDVKDLNITVAKGAASAAAANGAGLTVDGADVGWYYDHPTVSWTSNVAITVGNTTQKSTVNSTATFSPFGHMNRDYMDYDYTTTANINTVIAGPFTIANGYTLTITSGSRVAIV